MATPCTSCNHNRTVHIRWFTGEGARLGRRPSRIKTQARAFSFARVNFHIWIAILNKNQWIGTNKYFELEHVEVVVSINMHDRILQPATRNLCL
jgi:hypothetical protein